MTSPDETTVRRLILVRQLYLRGADYANDSTEIGRVLAIQTLDYTVEMLLKTVVSHFGTPSVYHGPESGFYNKLSQLRGQRYNPARIDFYRLWDEVTAILRIPENDIDSDNLPLRREINIMHNMRNDVQHNGIVPAVSEVRKYAAYAESFVREVSQNVFGRDLEEITLASLISDSEVQPYLAEAEIELESGRYRESIIAAATAFELAANQEKGRAPYRRRRSFFGLRREVERIGENIKAKRALGDFASSVVSSDRWAQRHLERFGENLTQAFEKLGEVLEGLQREQEDFRERLDVILLGGDLRKYRRFRLLSPKPIRTHDGRWHVNTPEEWEPTKEDAIEVLSFVFDTILRWQQLPLDEGD